MYAAAASCASPVSDGLRHNRTTVSYTSAANAQRDSSSRTRPYASRRGRAVTALARQPVQQARQHARDRVARAQRFQAAPRRACRAHIVDALAIARSQQIVDEAQTYQPCRHPPPLGRRVVTELRQVLEERSVLNRDVPNRHYGVRNSCRELVGPRENALIAVVASDRMPERFAAVSDSAPARRVESHDRVSGKSSEPAMVAERPRSRRTRT